MLLLFDIDGTLLQDAGGSHFGALYTVLADELDVPPDSFTGVDLPGRTDLEIARLLLEGQRLPGDRIDGLMERLPALWFDEYARRMADTPPPSATPGMPELVARLASRDDVLLALVTGNLEPIARLKLQRAGLRDYFDLGAFGSDSEVRAELPPLARERAGRNGRPYPRADTILVGDTVRDIACARADRLRCFAIATGVFGPDELRDADVVATDARSLGQALDQALENAPAGSAG